MKRIFLTIFIILGLGMLLGCAQGKKPLYFKDTITQDDIEQATSQFEIDEVFKLDITSQLDQSSSSDEILIFEGNIAYNVFEKQKLELGDLTALESIDVYSEYLALKFDSSKDIGYRIHSRITGDVLITLPHQNLENIITFRSDTIIHTKSVSGDTKITTYYFENGQLAEPPTNEDTDELEQVFPDDWLGDYKYYEQTNLIIINKNDKYYDSINTEISAGSTIRHYYLNNGNIIFEIRELLPTIAENYDYITDDRSQKFKVTHKLYNVKSRSLSVINLDFLLVSVWGLDNENPKLGNRIMFLPLDPETKSTLTLKRGRIDNQFKNLQELTIPYNGTPFLVNKGLYIVRTMLGVSRFDGKNKVLSEFNFSHSVYNYRIINRQSQLIVFHRTNNKAYIYDIKTGKLIHDEYSVFAYNGLDFLLTDQDNKVYAYSSKGITEIPGTEHVFFGQLIISKNANGLYDFYSPYGDLLFSHANNTILNTYSFDNGDDGYLIVQLGDGDTYKHMVVSVKLVSE